MVILGIIVLIVGFFVARPVLLPLGCVLIVVGVIWDIIAFTGHAIGAVF